MHFHCWELAKTVNDKDHPFILKGEAIDGLFMHTECKKCCECSGARYLSGVRRELAAYSPDMTQIPLCGRCNASIEAGDFCGVTMIVGKQYDVKYNMCEACRKFMVDHILLAFQREKKLQPKNAPYKRNIII